MISFIRSDLTTNKFRYSLLNVNSVNNYVLRRKVTSISNIRLGDFLLSIDIEIITNVIILTKFQPNALRVQY